MHGTRKPSAPPKGHVARGRKTSMAHFVDDAEQLHVLDDPPTRDVSAGRPAHLSELQAWGPPEPAAHAAIYTIAYLPVRWHDALAIVSRAVHRNQDFTVSYCLKHLPRLTEALPSLDTLANAREILQANGDTDAAGTYRNWSFRIDPGNAGSSKYQLRRFYIKERDRLSGALAASVGLPRHTIDVLAVGTVMMEIDVVPQSIREHMAEQLVEFKRQLRLRAGRAMSAASAVLRTTSDEPEHRALDFYRDVIADDGDDE